MKKLGKVLWLAIINLIFLGLKYGYNCTLHWDSNSNFLMYLLFYEKFNFSVQYLIKISAYTADGLKLEVV